jgi:hypothetical protein
MREVNKKMSVEKQIQKIEEYINWVKIDDNYKRLKEFWFGYKDEQIIRLENIINNIKSGFGYCENHDKHYLNCIEHLVKKNK